MTKGDTRNDRKLYDNIRTLWLLWNTGDDPLLNCDFITRFEGEFLFGYLVSYYQNEPERVQEAYEYFGIKIDTWNTELFD